LKLQNFTGFLKLSSLHENSDMDFSMQTWGEVGQDSQPPNSGFEGTSGEPMDYSAGYTGEEEEDDTISIDDERKKKNRGSKKKGIKEIQALIKDLEGRITALEPEKEPVTTEPAES
jgi:hypothetical protein